jgi:IclR family pca regulon transcriptional regulator
MNRREQLEEIKEDAEQAEQVEQADQLDQDDPYIVGALVRGLEVLRAFNAEHPSLSMTELAHVLGWNRTAPFRLVYTLQKLGYLHQDQQTKRYSLGSRVMELGFEYLHSLQLPDLAQPYLERLREETSASAHLGILEGAEVVYVARVQTRLMSASNIHIGSRLPAHATSMGKVLLAFQPAETLERLVKDSRLTAYTVRTITDPVKLRRELIAIRERGYVFNDQEFELGVRSIAAPVYGQGGKVIAALNVSAPTPVLTDEKVDQVAIPAVRRATAELSASLGYRKS